MLVLTRRLDESIHIGPDVTVTVVAIRGDKIRLGISAPRSVEVDRAEVRAAVLRDGRRLTGLPRPGQIDPAAPGAETEGRAGL